MDSSARLDPGRVVPIEGGVRLAFQDPHWGRKLLFGSAWALVPVLGWLVLCGWCQRAFLRGATNRPPLPEFDEPFALMGEGVAGFTAVLLWFVLPVLAPIWAMAWFTGSAAGQEAAMSSWFLPVVLVLASVLSVGLVAILKLLPAALIGVGASGSLWPALDVPAMTRLVREAFRPLLYAVVFYVLSQALGQFALLLCGVGILPALVWNHGMTAWMLGRVHAAHAGAELADIDTLLLESEG